MEVAIFTDCYKPIKNGVVTSVSQLKKGLEKKGHHVAIVTVNVCGYEEKDTNVLRVRSFPIGLGTEQVFGWVDQSKVYKFIQEHNIKLVHTHTEFALGFSGKLAAKKLNLPHVHTTHTMWEEYRHYILRGMLFSSKLVRKYLRLFLRNTYAIISPSIKAKKYFLTLTPTIPIEVIPNGIDINGFKTSQLTEQNIKEKRAKYNTRESDTVIIFVGRLGKEKRITQLFDALTPVLKNYLDVKMVFVGDGPSLSELQHKAKSLNMEDQFLFTGFVNWDTVYELYSIADFFVTASLSEVHPMTLIEAIMCSLPIITRKDESYINLVQDGVNGFLADTDNQITERVLELITNKTKLKRFSQRSLNISHQFTAENHVNNVEKFYEKVLTSYPNRLNFMHESLTPEVRKLGS